MFLVQKGSTIRLLDIEKFFKNRIVVRVLIKNVSLRARAAIFAYRIEAYFRKDFCSTYVLPDELSKVFNNLIQAVAIECMPRDIKAPVVCGGDRDRFSFKRKPE